MRYTFILFLGSVVIAALNPTALVSALAQQQGTPEQRAACAPDVRRFCRSVTNGDAGGYLACLQQNSSRLSRACAAVVNSGGR